MMISKIEEELSKLTLKINTSVQEIQNANTSQLTKADLSVMCADSRSLLKQLRHQIEECERKAGLQDSEIDKSRMLQIAKRNHGEYLRLTDSLRRANLLTSAAIERQQKEALLNPTSEPTLTRRKDKSKMSAARANESITDSLRNSSQMMAEHLEQSGKTIENLANSSKSITQSGDELRSMQGHIKNARTLLTKYARKDVTDKVFIFLALVFFLSTVVYIVKKRLFGSTLDYTAYTNAPQHHHDTHLL